MKNLSKIAFVAAIALSTTGLYAVKKPAGEVGFKGTSSLEQNVSTVHYKDGSHVNMPGNFKHEGGLLNKGLKADADKFLEERNELQKADAQKKMAAKKSSDIDGITHTQLKSNTIFTEVGGQKHMSLIPVSAKHIHTGNPKHKAKVETLFSLSGGLSNVMNGIGDIAGMAATGAAAGGLISGAAGLLGGGVGEVVTAPVGAVIGGIGGALLSTAGKFISGVMSG